MSGASVGESSGKSTTAGSPPSGEEGVRDRESGGSGALLRGEVAAAQCRGDAHRTRLECSGRDQAMLSTNVAGPLRIRVVLRREGELSCVVARHSVGPGHRIHEWRSPVVGGPLMATHHHRKWSHKTSEELFGVEPIRKRWTDAAE